MAFSEKQMQIIDAAEQLIASKGYEGTSVRDIAEEAGVNLAMISYYFGSKEKLLHALFTARTSYVRLKVESLLKDDSLPPLEKMYVLADDYIERIMEKQRFHKIMMYEQMRDKGGLVAEMLMDLKKENAGHISKLIRDGQKKGAFRKDVDVVLLMNVLIGATTQTFTSEAFYRHYHNLETLSDEAVRGKLKKKLSTHIKIIFKALLTYEV